MPSRLRAAFSATCLLALVTACGPSGGAAFKELSPEKSFDCAVNLFIVSNMMDDKPDNADFALVKDNAIAAYTHYGTIYAKAKELDPAEFLGLVKLKAYKMTGRIPGGSKVSDSTVVSRAKACITPDPA